MRGAVLGKRVKSENRTAERLGRTGRASDSPPVRPTSPGAGSESRSTAEKAPAPPAAPPSRAGDHGHKAGRAGGGGEGYGRRRRRRLRRSRGGKKKKDGRRLGQGAGRVVGGRARLANGQPAGPLAGARQPAAHLGTWASASPSQSNAFICIAGPAHPPRPGDCSLRTQRGPHVGGGGPSPNSLPRGLGITFLARLLDFHSHPDIGREVEGHRALAQDIF